MLMTPDPAVRAAAIERTKAHIPFAARTGAAVIIGLLRGIVRPGRQSECVRHDAGSWPRKNRAKTARRDHLIRAFPTSTGSDPSSDPAHARDGQTDRPLRRTE